MARRNHGLEVERSPEFLDDPEAGEVNGVDLGRGEHLMAVTAIDEALGTESLAVEVTTESVEVVVDGLTVIISESGFVTVNGNQIELNYFAAHVLGLIAAEPDRLFTFTELRETFPDDTMTPTAFLRQFKDLNQRWSCAFGFPLLLKVDQQGRAYIYQLHHMITIEDQRTDIAVAIHADEVVRTDRDGYTKDRRALVQRNPGVGGGASKEMKGVLGQHLELGPDAVFASLSVLAKGRQFGERHIRMAMDDLGLVGKMAFSQQEVTRLAAYIANNY